MPVRITVSISRYLRTHPCEVLVHERLYLTTPGVERVRAVATVRVLPVHRDEVTGHMTLRQAGRVRLLLIIVRFTGVHLQVTPATTENVFKLYYY